MPTITWVPAGGGGPGKATVPPAASNDEGEGKQRRARKTFDERLDELTAYKAKHGHVNVKQRKNESLYRFCVDIRRARRHPKMSRPIKLTKEGIAALDALGFEWDQQNKPRRVVKTFEERLEELEAYKAEHGHVSVSEREDKSLYNFCTDTRYARKNPESRKGRKLTAERIASLDAIGFEWAPTKTFEERVEALNAYKAKHGHLKVKASEDKSLYNFCDNARSARRGTGAMKLTKERTASLDALGFDWAPQSRRVNNKSFQERLEELTAYKAKHGHLKVKASEDKNLYNFCNSIRQARRGTGAMKLTKERTASLDALGFDWEPQGAPKSFEERLEGLTAYKAKQGHLKVKKSEDKSLAQFCSDTRKSRKYPERSKGVKLTEERIAALDALGFEWGPNKGRQREKSRAGG